LSNISEGTHQQYLQPLLCQSIKKPVKTPNKNIYFEKTRKTQSRDNHYGTNLITQQTDYLNTFKLSQGKETAMLKLALPSDFPEDCH
jgi:hypothetical protein